MNPSAIELQEEIDLRLLANLSDNFRSAFEATFEVVDNGLASRIPGKRVVVEITGSGRVGGSLKMTAKGGRGMGAAELADFLRWGKKPSEVGLNRYGQGGKAAIGYLGQGVRIRANPDGEVLAYEFEDRDWLSRPDGKKKTFLAAPVPAPFPGEGFVELEIMHLKRYLNFKKLERELAWRYRPVLANGTLDIRVKNRKVHPAPLDSDRRHTICETLIITSDAGSAMPVRLQGWVGIAPPGWEGRGGIRCSSHGRVVTQNEYFGHRDIRFKASLNSLIGEVDLSFVPIILNKTAFDQATPAWEAASKVMNHEMQPLVKKLLARKDAPEPTDEERERAMEARDIAHRALERLAAESARKGTLGSLNGRKPPETRDGEKGRPSQPRESGTTNEPRTSPPANAVGRLRRSGMTLDWDVKALDSKIRSTSVERNGRVEIYVNSQYPLYIEWAGDLRYILETGLMEELKPTAVDDKTVAEYFEQVNDALRASLIELRRTRGRRAT